MRTLVFNVPILINSTINRTGMLKSVQIEFPTLNFEYCRHQKNNVRSSKIPTSVSYSNAESEDMENSFQELRVPNHWLEPSKALEESEWLRVNLNKWLDDEYCPEPTNIEISKVASTSFYNSLMGKRADLGEILLKMALDLESISYQESFHGAFSSANAAVNLVIQRISHE